MRELEVLAGRYPQEREEILTEAAEVWARAGEVEQALALYDRLPAGPLDDPQMVVAYRIGTLCDAGRMTDAREAAEGLRATHPRDGDVWHYVGESFEAGSDPEPAAEWFTAGFAHLVGAGPLDADAVDRGTSGLDTLLMSRHRVRRRLGRPHDDWDEAADQAHARHAPLFGGTKSLDELHAPAPVLPARAELEALRAQSAALAEEHDRLAEEIAQRRATRLRPSMLCALYWPQGEFDALLQRRPDLQEYYGDDHADHLRQVESLLRSYSEEGEPHLGTAPGRVADRIECARTEAEDLAESSTRAGYAADLAARGLGQSWPPPRNGPCWCGDGRKYKKCHGSPAGAL
ncbi:SEC-C domain-containing protein [Streptomyces sp. NPDC026589]|uniref:SEC-C domain-containing protein n=1 Tax=Streptomyces sp. NPDC026589 TaxID=3155609 RepID=UPI00340A7A61